MVISVPHGGALTPAEIPDRTTGTTVTDANTEEAGHAVREAFVQRTGKAPHLVISHLKRTKLDPNREIVEAAQGNPYAENAWGEFETYIEVAESLVVDGFGAGLYLDLHGHGHAVDRLELGYLLSASALALDDAALDARGYADSAAFAREPPGVRGQPGRHRGSVPGGALGLLCRITSMTLVDAHVHVDRYGDDWSAMRDEMRRHGIVTLAVSMDVPSYRATVASSRQEPLVLPSFGIHPWNATEWSGRLHELDALVDEAPMLGEVGLDRRFVKDVAAYGPQEEVLAFFLDAARRTRKILNVHTSGAEARVADRMRDAGAPLAVVHWYNGPMRPLSALIEMGAYFSIGVEVLRSERIARIARRVPLDRLLSETDNPGGWAWLEGPPGSPALLERVVDRLAEVRAADRDELAGVLEANARRLLGEGGVPWPGSAAG